MPAAATSARAPAGVGAHQRKRSVGGTLQFHDAAGRRRTVQLDELADDDRELAEKFGYKPVRSLPHLVDMMIDSIP
jgi:hypothetical protein